MERVPGSSGEYSIVRNVTACYTMEHYRMGRNSIGHNQAIVEPGGSLVESHYARPRVESRESESQRVGESGSR